MSKIYFECVCGKKITREFDSDDCDYDQIHSKCPKCGTDIIYYPNSWDISYKILDDEGYTLKKGK